jgi:hypothetical protein
MNLFLWLCIFRCVLMWWWCVKHWVYTNLWGSFSSLEFGPKPVIVDYVFEIHSKWPIVSSFWSHIKQRSWCGNPHLARRSADGLKSYLASWLIMRNVAHLHASACGELLINRLWKYQSKCQKYFVRRFFIFSVLMFHLVITWHLFSSRSGCRGAARCKRYVFIGSLILVCGHICVSPHTELDGSLVRKRASSSMQDMVGLKQWMHSNKLEVLPTLHLLLTIKTWAQHT